MIRLASGRESLCSNVETHISLKGKKAGGETRETAGSLRSTV